MACLHSSIPTMRLHMAISSMGHRKHGSHAAWAWAMDATQKRSRAATRVKYPADQLLPVVAAYSACCGATSSGVEGNFSKHMLLGKGRAPLKGETLEVHELKLAVDINNDERDLIVARARKNLVSILWSAPLVWQVQPTRSSPGGWCTWIIQGHHQCCPVSFVVLNLALDVKGLGHRVCGGGGMQTNISQLEH